MFNALHHRHQRLYSIVAAGFWLGGIGLSCSIQERAPRTLAATLLGNYFLGWGGVLVMAQPPRLQVIVRFTLTTLSLALSLGSLELLSMTGLVDFRLAFVAGGPHPCNSPDNARDPELIHIHKPYLKRVGATRGDIALALHLAGTPHYPYEVDCDRNGFRNATDLSEAEIVVLGDSYVEGGLVAVDDLMTTTLGRLLGCTVANLGQSGYGPQQELVVLKRHAAMMHPRLCIWTFYEGNDLEDVERYEQMTRDGGRRFIGSTPWDRSFGRNLLQMLAERLDPFFAPDKADQAPWGTFQGRDGRTTRFYFRARDLSRSSRASLALNKVVAVLKDAQAVCAASRIPLLIVFAPEKFRVYKDYCTFRPENPCARWVLDDLPERLRVQVASLGAGIGYLDLTPTLTAEVARGCVLYFADDTHWTADGQQAAGRAVADYVARRGDLAFPAHPPRGRQDRALSQRGPIMARRG